jgi:hypothetical protein
LFSTLENLEFSGFLELEKVFGKSFGKPLFGVAGMSLKP